MKNIIGEYNTVAPAVNVGTLVKEDITSYWLFFWFFLHPYFIKEHATSGLCSLCIID